MDWVKVISDPLGIVGFALALVFSVVSRVVTQKGKKKAQWIIPVAYALAVVCVVGGLALAYERVHIHGAAQLPNSSAASLQSQGLATPSMRIDKIDQKTTTGNAIAGVQGNVTVTAPVPQKEAKTK